jgi:Tol biopolymer transport system component
MRPSLRVALIVVVVFVMIGASPAGAAAPSNRAAPAAGFIDYARPSPAGDPGIWAMRADGSEDHFVMAIPKGSSALAWSPDGTRIAMVRGLPAEDPEGYDIWVMDPDGSDLTRLTRHRGAEGHPTWSPDGRWVAFQRTLRRATSIFRKDVDAPDDPAIRLTRSATRSQIVINDTRPAWSPSGDNIVFGRDRIDLECACDAFSLGSVTSGGTFQRVGRQLSQPSWSPSGDRLAAINPGDCCNWSGPLYTLDPDGSDVVQIVQHDWDYFGSSIWSPDGMQIAFEAGDGCFSWWIVPADGSEAAVQVPLPTCAYAVAWRSA